jgi:hypothetical protein
MTTERAKDCHVSRKIASCDWTESGAYLTNPTVQELLKENARLKEVLVYLTSIMVRNVTRGV